MTNTARYNKAHDSIRIENILVNTNNTSGLDEFITALIEILGTPHFYVTGKTGPYLLRSLREKINNSFAENCVIPRTRQQVWNNLVTMPYEMVICNLPDLGDLIARQEPDFIDVLNLIEVERITTLRAAAANFKRVAVLSNPGQYKGFLEKLNKNQNGVSFEYRYKLARQALTITSAYDAMVEKFWLNTDFEKDALPCFELT